MASKRRVKSLIFVRKCISKRFLLRNFEYDWLIELSDNKLSNDKLSDNNLTSELVENRIFFKTNHNRGNSNFYD